MLSDLKNQIERFYFKSVCIIFFLYIAFGPFNREHVEHGKVFIDGFYIGAMYNHWNYIVETNDWNSFIFYDKSVNRGVDWWVRLDEHRYNNADLYYLDISSFVTGNPEPRAFLPYSVAMILRYSGRGIYLLNKAAPISFILLILEDSIIFSDTLEKDRITGKSLDRSTIFKYICVWFGAKLGANLGTLILPGIGTLFGSLGGGIASRTLFSCFFNKIPI
ncbi:hypothetical protein GCK72_020379 [Caenorhabditis remanei]|uniref:Uncharacterized protein n=1 Tax=Caenorhabditis remanei TaxID=31234 RepID=A0A6A5GH37_CAERE|nr:hypothetical protein GCK72_020379 [Caenorhabditis remanei]KAF1753822.1 hypothetical protein GCK72_020379 [Caenorhabditis remanei]